MDMLMSRRSIRKFKSTSVTEEQIKIMLHAAMMAPSAVNGQPWQFIVCDDRRIIDEIIKHQPYARSLETAPLCVVVCGDEGNIKGYYQQDCAAATQNLMLAAYELGLGTCWMGVAPRPDRMDPVREQFALPESVMPFCLIAVGVPDEVPAQPERWKEEKVHRNSW